MTEQPKTPSRSGYAKPPVATRFAKGTSGNPRGRPRGSVKRPPYEAILGQPVTIREDGRARTVTAAEAFLLQITKKGLEGDGPAARAALAAIEEARARGYASDPEAITQITRVIVSPGSVNRGLIPLGMATKLDRLRPTARMKIEPWLVEAALARLGSRRLTKAQQAVVYGATRTPWKVRWPEWWVVRG